MPFFPIKYKHSFQFVVISNSKRKIGDSITLYKQLLSCGILCYAVEVISFGSLNGFLSF